MDLNRQHIKHYKAINTGEVGLPVCFDHADETGFYDSNNKRYLDFTSGYGVTNAGWIRPELDKVILDQLKKSAYAPPWLPTVEAIELSKLILSLVPSNLVYCARATGGADANEIIQKAVYNCNGKSKVLSFRRSYHGGSHFTLNISEPEMFNLPQVSSGEQYIYTDPPYCYRCPFGKQPSSCSFECTEKIKDIFKEEDIGSFFAEPVIGSGGIIIPPEGYWQKIRNLCDEYGVFLVFDEVLTGFGRIGKISATEYFGVVPDAISFAKGITNGYAALGVAVLSAPLATALKQHEDVSSTFAWTPLSCAVARANIEFILQNNLPENAKAMGDLLKARLKQLFTTYFPDQTGDIRGIGLMIGIEMVADSHIKTPDKTFIKKFIIRAMKNGLMVCASWDFQAIVLMPPLCIGHKDLEEALSIIERTLSELKLPEQVKQLNAVS